jgi:glycosyltransferase involved in cell wall biosynthesis
MRQRPIILAIPTLNEEESIGPLLRSIPRGAVDRIIVADGSSTDATPARARAEGAEVIDAGRGYGRACFMAAQVAPGGAVMVYMDGDGADDPALIAAMTAPILAGTHDFVIGSRWRGTREKGSMGWHQMGAGLVFGTAVGMLYGTRYTDMCAFRAISRDALLALGMSEMTYGWNLEMQMKAARAKLRILEIPVPNRCRIGGTSKVSGSLKGTWRAGTRIIAAFLRIARERPSASPSVPVQEVKS